MSNNETPHINGDTNVVPITSAARLMKDPAAAAGIAPQPTAVIAPGIDDEGTQKLLNNLPGLVGAINQAILDTSGKAHGFMLMVFTDTAVLHATNVDAAQAQAAVTAVVDDWRKTGDRGTETPIAAGVTGDAPADPPADGG